MCGQVAFIEELQRRLGPQEGSRNGMGLAFSKSTPDLARRHAADSDLEAVLRGEHRAPFELRALEVALDVVRAWAVCSAMRVLPLRSAAELTPAAGPCRSPTPWSASRWTWKRLPTPLWTS